jgi:hypothetical protein
MLEVKILRRCFGYTAIMFGFVFVALLPLCRMTVRMPPHLDFAGPVLLATIVLMTVLPAVLTVVNGTAWWMIRKNNPSARSWAIAASICLLLMSVPFYLTGSLMLHYNAARILLYQDLIAGIVLTSLGTVSLIAFAGYNGLDREVHQEPEPHISAKLLMTNTKIA